MAQHLPRKNAIDYYDTQPTPATRAVEADTAVLPKAKAGTQFAKLSSDGHGES